ncbi:Rossmann-like and DUF2520 domain-containing protein [Leucobacter denitrificans]|uniref:DUF2520 domain-containing protein n=1 Tax=Leucobacter denitrificans TaxID=683042 RepID=A0A7G9S1Y3_9MICO|nr:DUF2520 domain-containing protein [Leucobacter denitrificans]QNN61858.1 DUF2520 domain-containing protein [Leucobacter denitrificans]
MSTASQRVSEIGRVLVVGAGRMGSAIAGALRAAGVDVLGPEGRGSTGEGADVVLLAVPDSAIASAASLIPPGRLVGHLSGATELAPLSPHESFSLHPLTTVAGAGHDFSGGYAAVDGGTKRALSVARQLAGALSMTAFQVRDVDRTAYHAAASIASNFLVTLEGFAEQLAASAGVDREALLPLVRAAVENWAERGAKGALTGPIVRGDEATVERQRAAVAERLPEQVGLFDALAAATRELAARSKSASDSLVQGHDSEPDIGVDQAQDTANGGTA